MAERKQRARAPKAVRLPVLKDDASGLPFFSARWVPKILGGGLPHEEIATCGDCAMLPPEGETGSGNGAYFTTSRCCTYVPTTANFLVGALFLDPDPALEDGRGRATARISRRLGLTPLGLLPTEYERLTLDHISGAFGKHRTLVCPNFRESDAGCTVWRYRSAVCMSWFCKHVRGATGNALWRAVQTLVHQIERSVAFQCALEVGLGDDAFRALSLPRSAEHDLSPRDLEGGEDEGARAMWGGWFGREREFFEACARVAFRLDVAGVLAAGGAELEGAIRAARAALSQHGDTSIPKRLAIKPFEVIAMDAESTRLKTYSPYDPLEVPNALLPLLSSFDGRPTAKVVASVLKEHGVDLDDDLLRQLVDFELLAAQG